MKNFKTYNPEKYNQENYQLIQENIYMSKDDDCYVTSLTFEMEEVDGYDWETASPQNITQFPFEGILDNFRVWVCDFYEDLNESSELTCYQEFGSDSLEDLIELRTLIGKRAYGKIDDPSDEDSDWALVIE